MKNFFYTLHDGKDLVFYKGTEQLRLYDAQTGTPYYKATILFTDDISEAARFELATDALRVGAVLDDMNEENVFNYDQVVDHIKRLRIRSVGITYVLLP